MMNTVYYLPKDNNYIEVPQSIYVHTLSTQLQSGFYLTYIDQKLTLCHTSSKLTLCVDFANVEIQNRIKTNAAKLDLVKAVEGKRKTQLSILDMTAGLGQDSFCLASRGHHITAIEQNPYVFLLVNDGLIRAQQDIKLQDSASRIRLYFANAINFATLDLSHQAYDVIYLDPMFPERLKSAKVKKNMQLLHQLVGIDEQNNDALFLFAQSFFAKKIVVKRPRLGEFLVGKRPTSQLIAKSSRFDIYASHTT